MLHLLATREAQQSHAQPEWEMRTESNYGHHLPLSSSLQTASTPFYCAGACVSGVPPCVRACMQDVKERHTLVAHTLRTQQVPFCACAFARCPEQAHPCGAQEH
eukprot:scaffold14715_cov22-Tisochrysis_lutea.AAC.2